MQICRTPLTVTAAITEQPRQAKQRKDQSAITDVHNLEPVHDARHSANLLSSGDSIANCSKAHQHVCGCIALESLQIWSETIIALSDRRMCNLGVLTVNCMFGMIVAGRMHGLHKIMTACSCLV